MYCKPLWNYGSTGSRSSKIPLLCGTLHCAPPVHPLCTPCAHPVHAQHGFAFSGFVRIIHVSYFLFMRKSWYFRKVSIFVFPFWVHDFLLRRPSRDANEGGDNFANVNLQKLRSDPSSRRYRIPSCCSSCTLRQNAKWFTYGVGQLPCTLFIFACTVQTFCPKPPRLAPLPPVQW